MISQREEHFTFLEIGKTKLFCSSPTQGLLLFFDFFVIAFEIYVANLFLINLLIN